ncbi:hypothetical protein ACGE0T_14275 [Parabacteroides sp. APC149_11_2_Y6]
MERIKLTKVEKETLRIVAVSGSDCPSTYPIHIFKASVRSLQRKGLVNAIFVNDGKLWHADLTDEGRLYICQNPNLRNPINWEIVIGVIALAVSIIALFVSCIR